MLDSATCKSASSNLSANTNRMYGFTHKYANAYMGTAMYGFSPKDAKAYMVRL